MSSLSLSPNLFETARAIFRFLKRDSLEIMPTYKSVAPNRSFAPLFCTGVSLSPSDDSRRTSLGQKNSVGMENQLESRSLLSRNNRKNNSSSSLLLPNLTLKSPDIVTMDNDIDELSDDYKDVVELNSGSSSTLSLQSSSSPSRRVKFITSSNNSNQVRVYIIIILVKIYVY